MPPGIFRLRTACCTLVIPVRLAICLPLLIFTLDAYSPPAAPLPQGGVLPLIINNTHIDDPASSNLPEDAHTIPVYIALRPTSPRSNNTPIGRVLTLSFVITAAMLSVLSLITLWWFSDSPEDEQDDATLVEGSRARRLHLGTLFLGIATRLLLGGLGMTAMVRVMSERSTIKRNSFIAVQVLGWLLVAVLLCGAFHRIHCLSCSFGAFQGKRRDQVLPAHGIGKHDGVLETTSSKL